MKVWIAFRGQYGDRRPVGVFSTEVAADKIADKVLAWRTVSGLTKDAYPDTEEFELDAAITLRSEVGL